MVDVQRKWRAGQHRTKEMGVNTVRVDTTSSILFPVNDILHAYYGVLHQKISKRLEFNFKQWEIIKIYNKRCIKEKPISSFLL